MFLLARLLGLKQRLNAFGVDKADADDLDRPGRAEAVDARGESDAAAVRAKGGNEIIKRRIVDC
jgi:hypothetical protein